MKRLSTIIMALALVLGMSQCKKQETPTSTGNNTEGTVHITVKVDGKDENGDKHAIAPEHGLFAFTNDDIIYVGHGGKYVGQLEFTNGFFEGDITPVAGANDYLHFYFLGGMTPAPAPTVGTTESFTISIANQSQNLPVLSYGASTTQFTDLNTTYSVTLKNKCALVKLSLVNPTTETVTLSDVPTVATVNFANPTLATAIEATDLEELNDITLRYDANWNENLRWVILLPGTDLSNCGVTWQGEGNMPAMENNTYVNANLQLNNPAALPAAPDAQYAVHTAGENPVLTQFSVSENKKVYFSCGNLRFGVDAGENGSSNPGWSLHPSQFAEHEGYNGSHHPTSQNPSSDMDRICWGRLPNDGGNYAYPAGGYWIYENDADLSRADNTDWGTVLTTEGNNWRMLTASEWNYLFNGDPNDPNVRGTRRFLKVRIVIPDNLVNIYGSPSGFRYGVLLLPDNYDGDGLSMKDRNNNTYSFNGNGVVLMKPLQTDGSDDVSKMLNAGAVFLPALGYRDGDELVVNQYLHYTFYELENGIFYGYYWSSTRLENGGAQAKDRKAKALYFTSNTINTNYNEFRRRGACVRLVWDAN